MPILVVVLLTRVTNHELIGVLLFWAAGMTDLLDGYLARRWKQVTTLGKLLDPLADKLLIMGALISLVELDLAPAWMTFIILGREMAITGLRGIASEEGITIAAERPGQVEAGRPDRRHLLPHPRAQAGRLALCVDPPGHLPLLHPAAQALQLLLGHGRAPALGRHDPVRVERRLLLPQFLETLGPASSTGEGRLTGARNGHDPRLGPARAGGIHDPKYLLAGFFTLLPSA